MASYNDMARTVLDYYTNPEQLVQYGGWEKVFDPNNTYSLEQAYEAIRSNPNIQIIERTDGTIVGWWNKSTGSGSLVNDVGSLPNSNTAGGSLASNSLVNINTSPVVTQVPGSTTWHIANAPAVGEKWGTNGGVSGAILTVMAGIKLGLTFDAALYEVGKYTDIFTDEQLAALNPDNWKQIGSVVDEHWTEAGYPTIGKIGRYVFDTLTYVGQDYSSQTYVDEDAFTYAAQYLYKSGLLNSNSPVAPTSSYKGEFHELEGDSYTNQLYYKNAVESAKVNYPDITFPIYTTGEYVWKSPARNALEVGYIGSGSYYATKDTEVHVEVLTPGEFVLSGNPNGAVWKIYDGSIIIEATNVYKLKTTYWYFNKNTFKLPTDVVMEKIPSVKFSSNVSCFYSAATTGRYYSSPNCFWYFNYSYQQGIGSQQDAILPDFSTATDFDSFKTLLKQQYPDMWDSAVTRDVLQPDGTLKRFTYVPVPIPNATDWMDTQPTGDGSQQSQKDTVVNPDMDTSIKDTISSSSSTSPTTPNPPDTGGGSSPTVVPPIGKASSLWSIYNPTLEQVNQFGSWLWSSNFVEQLKKLFNDPMQAIIGLHKVYSPVQTSGQGTIKCGYLDSGVPSKLVSEQYVTVDCGSVDMQEYFGNVFDYPPYTEVSIYLPFIGIRQLDPSDVMRSTISVKYHIDVLTGACLAEVNVQRDASGGTLYTFSGDAAVRYPVSSGSYMGIVSGLIGVATSVVSGNLLPALSGVTRLHTNVDHSGSFTGNAGAMASKVPYLIISRPQTAMADKFETLSGYPSNTFTPLSACKGFTQVKFVHVENLNATDAEKQEIEQMLKEGVIL